MVFLCYACNIYNLWIKLEGDMGKIKVSLRDQTSPCSELKEKFKCVEYIGKDEMWAETSP